MSPSQLPNEHMKKPLTEFLSAASVVWDTYRKDGPGKVDASLFEPVETAYLELDRLLSESAKAGELREAVAEVYDLSQRCACRVEGLCFVTGEAGLIPRRDKEAAYAERLAWLQGVVV